MKHVVTLWLALFFGFAATLETLGNPGSFSFQEAKLKGIIRQVQSDGSKPPIAGALIMLQGTAETGKASRTAVTDEEGRFTLFDLLPGDYVLTVEVAGFETYSKTYKIVSGAVSTVDIDLKIKATTDIVEVKSDPD
ncbi:MAG TPA: carboxypeptidase-like regulatory domain-containing protein, partial [Acidobacteriota bacterium]|nr:carboxypeptidase-like regulatory domain-containing protein [Acidobacteriota bacterium]